MDPGVEVPDLRTVSHVADMVPTTPTELVAVYFDTDDLALVRHGVTLRRRVGGTDSGWHLKKPVGPDTREETRWPLGRTARTVPEPLREAVATLTEGRDLTPVARVATDRVEHELISPDGSRVAVICDDDVRAVRCLAPGLRQHWREWEVELAEGGEEDLLDRIEEVLLAAGARPSDTPSKLARTLAIVTTHPRTAAAVSDARPSRWSAREALAAYLVDQMAVLRQHDEELRGETVHRLRIAARRARAALATYRPLFEDGDCEDLRGELRWLGQELGQARDAEVLAGHFAALTAHGFDDPAGTATRERIRRVLDTAGGVAREAALEALGSERYEQLVRSVEAVIESPDLRPEASRPACTVLPGLLERDARRVRRAAEAASRASSGPARDRALHDARKAAKRLRYAAELATPVLGKRAEKLATRAKALQDSLGTHQDSVAARTWLSALATCGEAGPAVAFGAGRLFALEEQRARGSRTAYERALRRLPGPRVDRWLRRRP